MLVGTDVGLAKRSWVHLYAFLPLMVGFLWNICIVPSTLQGTEAMTGPLAKAN